MQPKVMTIVGTRPEVIKLSRVIAELDARVRHVLVHTGQNFDYELNDIFFEQLQIRRPDHLLEVAAPEPAAAIANIIARTDQVMQREAPDALLLLGDTNSCLCAIAAKRRKIPIFHMEAGNRCFDQRVPEEINRRIVDHISDVNLPYTEHARRYLLAEGLPADRIIKTGSPMKEVLRHYGPRIDASNVIGELGLRAAEYFLVSAHREENVDEERSLQALLECLQAVWDRHQVPVIVSTHPRTRQRLERVGAASINGDVRFLRPMGFPDYVSLAKSARCVLSDSGTLTEESAIAGFPAVALRAAHERPEGMDAGSVVLAGLSARRVLQAVDLVTQQGATATLSSGLPPDYDVDDVARKVVRIILGYIDYVNRFVWRKQL